MTINKCLSIFFLFFLVLDIVRLFPTSENGKPQNEKVNVDPIFIEVSWSTHDYNLHTVPSVLVPANPLSSRQFSPIDKEIYANLKELNVEYARYGAWYPFPHISVAELDPPSGLFQCGNVGSNFSIELSCEQSGGVISKIDFASFGTSSGACGQMKQGTCHAANSSDVVGKICLGKQKCSVPATHNLFGDPCKFHYHTPLFPIVHCHSKIPFFLYT
jgi:hypothetical protein